MLRHARAAGVRAGIHFRGGAEQQAPFLEMGANMLIHSADITLFSKHPGSDPAAIRKAAGLVQEKAESQGTIDIENGRKATAAAKDGARMKQNESRGKHVEAMMMGRIRWSLFLLTAITLIVETNAMDLMDVPAGEFVSVRDGRLYLSGHEYRAAGVNVPNLSQSYMGTWHHDTQIYRTTEKAREAMIGALDDLAEHEIPYIRFFAGVGYPVDAQKLYMKDRDEYWRQMDELFALCRERHIRLIPSLAVFDTWAGYHGEHRNAILDPASKTHASAYGYVREFVTRYRDDPIVLMWELHNEIFLHADLNFTGRKPKFAALYPPGTRGHRLEPTTIEDYYTTDMLVQVCADMTRFIKSIDPNHPVTTGDSHPRDCSKSLRENWPKHVWKFDTIEQHCESLLLQQARPLDVISLHIYGNEGKSQKVDNLPIVDYARAMIRAAHADGRPVLVGEFGQGPDLFLKDDPRAEWFLECFDMFEAEDVSLITLWTVHFPWQKRDFNIPNCGAHPVVFERIRRFNIASGSEPRKGMGFGRPAYRSD